AATTPPRRLPPPRAQRARAPEEPDAKPPEPAPGPRTTLPRPAPVRTRPFARLPRAGHALALTFDDGPDPRWTPEVLAVLAAHDVRATFFVCGRQAAKHPALLRRITEAGHLVGNHTWDHRRLTGLGRAAVEEQIARTSETVRRATGRAPAWFRAPYGEWDRTVYTLGARHGMEPLAWSVDTEDWSRPGAAAITRRVLAGRAPGPSSCATTAAATAPRRSPRCGASCPASGRRLGPGPPGPTADAGRCEVGRARRRASGRQGGG
ncbi:polysaccharide deacetylase family protein, partial [Streptomyces sp. SA3_actF]|uniref:polysaccharide deacetylase family protein n=1 Tax=Streptomyces sp. SA3_actF TaxID=682181 RepID=UPI000200086C